MDVVERFAAEVQQFAAWARAGTDSGAVAARNGLLHLARLHLFALELPASAGRTGEDLPDARVDDAEWKSVFANAARLPFNFYGEVFDPLPVPAEESVVASLADDIADIYRDVVTGLRHYQAERCDEALWQWAFSLQAHWGEHITGAIRALHCWLAANDPSRLSAET